MGTFESIADRRIRAAREAGLFDGLAGAGKPIPDLDRERPPGWWAARVVRRERSMLRAEQLDDLIRTSMPALWRLDAEAEVRARVAELNERIDAYNATSTWEPRTRLDEGDTVGRWRQIRGLGRSGPGPG